MKWLPIKSAPQDGTRILVIAGGVHQIANWDDDKYAARPKPFWKTTSNGGLLIIRATQPTVWMPLPPKP